MNSWKEATLRHCKPLILIAVTAVSLSCQLMAAQSVSSIPVPAPQLTEREKIELGKTLFQDPLFAKNLSTSCASCHQLKNSGVDNLTRYLTINKTQGSVNTPSVFNASLNFRQFWNGRAKTIADAIDDHVKDETIFANNWPDIVHKIGANSLYASSFKKIYANGVTKDNINNALTVYIENLVTPNSAFDRYLKGDKTALSNEELKGYRLFRKYGCVSCHQGPNMGGNLFQRLGIYKNYFADKGTNGKADLGLYNVTGKEEDKYVFKVPSLRNIALTGPYLHDGSVKTLPEMIQIMGIYQAGQPIRNEDANAIAQFLQSLNATPEKELLTIENTETK